MSEEGASEPARSPRGVLKRARMLRTARELGMELFVVALGVLIALWAQQWAEGRSWREKKSAALDAIGVEIADQYDSAVEWRLVEPCLLSQIDTLRQRVLTSPGRLVPAPLFADSWRGTFVVRMPDRSYEDGAWQRAISDGVASRLDRKVRFELDGAYAATRLLNDLTAQNRAAQERLLSLSQPLPLDPGTRLSLLQEIDQLRGRITFMDLVMAQALDHWRTAGVLPPLRRAQTASTLKGTRLFCRTHGLQVRTLAEAISTGD